MTGISPRRLRFALAGALAGCASTASAASYVATAANFKSIFAGAAGGDTIVLSGRFSTTVFQNRSFATPLKIDARAAQFNGVLVVRDMRGLVFTGGRYGASTDTYQNAGTIRVENSDSIHFTNPQLVGDGLGKARGLTFGDSSDFSVTGGTFSGFRLALASGSSSDGVFASNRITRSTSEGINISNSHFITARGNVCSGGIPSVGAHPDCIQMWSVTGQPVLSDIKLLGNEAYGRTQGFTLFNPERGGGLRISMIGNRVDTSLPQGIACYGCVDSIITDNVLTTLPGSRFRTYLRVIGGSNNIVANNSIAPYTTLAAPIAVTRLGLADSADVFLPAAAGRFSTLAEIDDEWSNAAFLGVPEPGIWAQLIGGFAALGVVLRRRRQRTARMFQIA